MMDTAHNLEKQSLAACPADNRAKRPSRARRWATALALGAVGCVAVIHLCWRTAARLPAAAESARDSLWSDITPTKDLQWHTCYGGKFECARLDVPLDWLEPTDEQRVYLAVIRQPAKTHIDYRGPVFVNPGGPGGSGIDFVVESGDDLQTIVGDNHDIISFDPRGVGASVPRVDCWSSQIARHDWQKAAIPVLDAHPGIVYDAYAMADALSQQCEEYISKESPGLLENLSTASHARDMLAISEAAGYPKLKYWGISYGSILGGTFAAMFPDRVERLISDGNVDYTSWYKLDQTNFFVDTDSVMEAFFFFCHKAGPERCAFHAPDSAGAIRERYFALLEQLRLRPVLVPAHAYDRDQQLPSSPTLITYSKFQMLILMSMYKPVYKFPELAEVMTALEKGNGLPFYQMTGVEKKPEVSECSIQSPSPMDPQNSNHVGDDAFRAITCSDGTPFTDTPDEFAKYTAQLKNISRYAGASYTHFKLGCVGRKIRPRERFPAPWIDPATHQPPNTSFPILFIGNIGDNVTPLSSAYRNSAAFPGSTVLVQNSWGHASLAAPSTCTANVIRAYFQDGRLPAKDTHCDQDLEIFGPQDDLEADEADVGEISSAVRSLSRRASIAHGHLLF